MEGILFLIVSIILNIYSLVNHYKTPNLEWKLSPYLFPILIGIFIGILAVLLIMEDLKFKKINNKKKEIIKWKAIIFTIIASIVYYYALKPIGFMVSSILFLASLFFYLGERRLLVVALISISSTLLIYVVFSVFLHAMLP